MVEGHIKKSIYDLYTYAKDNDVPFIAIMGSNSLMTSNKQTISPAFFWLLNILSMDNGGQINDDIETLVDRYVTEYKEDMEVDAVIDPGIISHMKEKSDQIYTQLEHSTEPWMISYEIITDNIVERITISPLLPFEKHPAFNVILFLAKFGDIANAAEQFTDIEFNEDKTDYKLFEKYKDI